LSYYLDKKSLDFDQGDALAAVIYLDKINKTNEADQYLQKWSEFVTDKPYLELNNIVSNFNTYINNVNNIIKNANK